MTAVVQLHANFRTTGLRWPLRPGDGVELWRDAELVGEISVELLVSLVTHYMVGHDLVRRFDATIVDAGSGQKLVGGALPQVEVTPLAPALRPARPLVKLPPRAVRDRDYRAELRARRRSRGAV